MSVGSETSRHYRRLQHALSDVQHGLDLEGASVEWDTQLEAARPAVGTDGTWRR